MRWLCLFLLFFLAPTALQGQGLAAWEVVLYAQSGEPGATTGELVALTPNGVTDRWAIPASAYGGEPVGLADAAIAPDRRHAAIALWGAGDLPGAPPVAIIDLTSGACCTFVAAPVADVEAYTLAGFSPDSSRLGIAYVGFDNREAFDTSGGFIVADAASGQITSQITMDAINATLGLDAFTVFPQPDAWLPEGIRFVGSCYACEGPFESRYSVWNPDTNQVGQAANAFYTILGETLDQTGEMLYTTQNTTYPVGEIAGMLPPANVVEYYADGDPIAMNEREGDEGGAPVVYFNPADLDLRPARWVLDGNAFVIQGSETNPMGVIVYRDGSQTQVMFPASSRFLTGTPDGFLAQNQAGWVVYYQYTGAQWNQIELEQLPFDARVVDHTPLGGSVLQPFNLLMQQPQLGVEEPPLAPQQQQQPEACPGFIGSRLVPGGLGRVTPGVPNNVRLSPSLQAQLVGQIPGGEVFEVLAGPQCDPAGIAWWQVRYGGLNGWTAEGQGESYYVEPAS